MFHRHLNSKRSSEGGTRTFTIFIISEKNRKCNNVNPKYDLIYTFVQDIPTAVQILGHINASVLIFRQPAPETHPQPRHPEYDGQTSG